ncbi:MAG: tobe domain protein [Bacteroidetes bacterium]|nr:MAG: tobe domain protein [Bacteroidota bacterium]
MNILSGTIQDLQVHGNLTLVKVVVSDITFTSIVIETPETAPYLSIGTPIKVMFKETEVIIGKSGADISLQNQIPVKVVSIEQGQLLSQLNLQYQEYTLCSIITSNAVKQLQLQPGVEVIAMIKTSEIMLSE